MKRIATTWDLGNGVSFTVPVEPSEDNMFVITDSVGETVSLDADQMNIIREIMMQPAEE